MRHALLIVLVCLSLSGCVSEDLGCSRIDTRLQVIQHFCESVSLRAAESNCEGDPAGEACVALRRAEALGPCLEMAGRPVTLWAQQEFCE